MEEYLSKIDYKKQVDIINEDINIYEDKINELKNNQKDKNYIQNKINSIKLSLGKCLQDDECYSDVFNEIVDKVFIYKEVDKKIRLEIFIKTGDSLYTTSDNLGKKFHLLDYDTPSCLINDTLTIIREINSIYTKKYDVLYEYKCFI